MRSIIFLIGNWIYKILTLFPVKQNRIVLECDYGKGFYCNPLYIYREILRQKLDYEIIIPLNPGVTINEPLNENTKIVRTKGPKHLFYLATSRYWITNNHYYFFLKRRPETEEINTWHALGAFKKFALHSAKDEEDVKKFNKDGENINYLLVSSEKLKPIYSTALNVPEDRILSIGIPRTDPLFHEEHKSQVKKQIQEKYNLPQDKKYILYAPTFRDDEKEHFNMMLDLKKMKETLGSEYVILLKLHPIIRNPYVIEEEYKNFIIDVTKENINALMMTSDMLITDYSSVIFEYAILDKPMIFFAYDYDKYKNELRNFYYTYDKFVPGPIVDSTEQIIDLVKNNNFDMEKIQKFSEEFCEYRDGKSSERFVNYFLGGKK